MPKLGGNIPKYILKRIIAPDALILDGNQLKLKIKNVLGTIKTKNFPDDAKELITVAIDDNELSAGGNSAFMDEVKVEFKGETFPFNELNKLEEIGVGETITFALPNKLNLQKGETHKLAFSIITNPNAASKKRKRPKEKPPLKFEVERVIM
ncbi:MAG: hypothetical protein ACFFCS_04005 [Candidatus Hodarchaeota archaeon]